MIARANVDNLSAPGRAPARRDVVRIARGPYAGRVGEVDQVKGKYLTVRVDPRWTPAQRTEISESIARLRREGMNRAQAVRAAFAEERERVPAMKFLTNPPPDRSRTMATPRRDPRTGRFVSSGRSRSSRSSRRHNPAHNLSASGRAHLRRLAESRPRNARGQFVSSGGSSSRRRNPVRRRAYHHERWDARKHPRNRFGEFVRTSGRRHNPPMADFPRWLGQGFLGAGELVVSKAVTKTLPGLISDKLTVGNTAYAVQMLVAVGLGWVADRFGGPRVGDFVLAGGLAAPIEQFLQDKNVKYIAPMLSRGALSAWSVSSEATVPPARRVGAGNMSAWSQAALLQEG